MTVPSEIRLDRATRVLHVTFDDGTAYALPCRISARGKPERRSPGSPPGPEADGRRPAPCRHHRHRTGRPLRGPPGVRRPARYRHLLLGLSGGTRREQDRRWAAYLDALASAACRVTLDRRAVGCPGPCRPAPRPERCRPGSLGDLRPQSRPYPARRRNRDRRHRSQREPATAPPSRAAPPPPDDAEGRDATPNRHAAGGRRPARRHRHRDMAAIPLRQAAGRPHARSARNDAAACAFRRLVSFLRDAHAERLRCVEVVTGRGNGETGGAIRREFPHWLNLPDIRPLVLGAAHPHALNPGSVRLLLRRIR